MKAAPELEAKEVAWCGEHVANELEGRGVELGGRELGGDLLKDDEEDRDHGEAAVVELGGLLGVELVWAEVVGGPWAGLQGGAGDDGVALDLLDLLHLEVGAGGGADLTGRLLECFERARLERADGEDGAGKGDEGLGLLERVLKGEDRELPLWEVGEERVERLGEEEARDREHGHAAVLELSLTILEHFLGVRAGSEAERVETLRERLGHANAAETLSKRLLLGRDGNDSGLAALTAQLRERDGH
mmetsp:Transcript_266/g.660  ORF Transcript_266/g.660 Transcript_266/m.660 type:complete len:246 (-) Transcript_266:142-879(-)